VSRARDRRPARRRRLAFGLVLALFVLLVVAVGAEVALRVAGGRPRGTKTHVADPVLHHRLREGVRTTVLGVPFETNALGLRDRDYGPEKPAGVMRVLMLGDSFTEGGGLRLEESVPKVLEARLAERGCARGVEVVNAGVASYSPILEYVYLREKGLALAPDLVVLNFDMTDVHDDAVRTAIARLDARGLPIAVPSDRRRETAVLLPPLPKPAWLRRLDGAERALNHLALWQALRRSGAGRSLFGPLRATADRMEALGVVGDARYDTMAITRDAEQPATAAAWQLTERYLRGIRNLARTRGAGFVLVLYPHAHQVSATAALRARDRFGVRPGLYASERPFRRLEEFGRREDIPVLNVVTRFRRRAAEGLYWDEDIHHTPLGARVLAEGIHDGLLERGLLPC
jgi:lysophospholipase L1-like esterase